MFYEMQCTSVNLPSTCFLLPNYWFCYRSFHDYENVLHISKSSTLWTLVLTRGGEAGTNYRASTILLRSLSMSVLSGRIN